MMENKTERGPAKKRNPKLAAAIVLALSASPSESAVRYDSDNTKEEITATNSHKTEVAALPSAKMEQEKRAATSGHSPWPSMLDHEHFKKEKDLVVIARELHEKYKGEIYAVREPGVEFEKSGLSAEKHTALDEAIEAIHRIDKLILNTLVVADGESLGNIIYHEPEGEVARKLRRLVGLLMTFFEDFEHDLRMRAQYEVEKQYKIDAGK